MSKTTQRLIALSIGLICVLVIAATALAGPDSAPAVDKGSQVQASPSASPTPAATDEPAQEFVGTGQVPSEREFIGTGQLQYTPPNADVPESLRGDTGDATCPGKDPCGP